MEYEKRCEPAPLIPPISAETAAAHSQHQHRIAGYRAGAELYRAGGYVVFRAVRLGDATPVIVKTWSGEAASRASRACLQREYEIVTALGADDVVKPWCALEDRQNLALVFADVGGQTLKQQIEGGRIGISAFLRTALAMVSTIAGLHRRNFVHGNINPGNILVDPDRGHAQLIDFGLASADADCPRNPSDYPLAYCSPEQTGRMNRAVDYRTDFYSLGVCFYEMLTGRLPFPSGDALELIHGHIARIPPAPAELCPHMPQPLSRIVMKLLAKTAEERYQSARGLREDLESCAREWAANAAIAAFPLGRNDVSDRFLVSQKLYGREREVAVMLTAFERACAGCVTPPSMMLVSGYSGIGKTTLIQELYKPIVRERGYSSPANSTRSRAACRSAP